MFWKFCKRDIFDVCFFCLFFLLFFFSIIEPQHEEKDGSYGALLMSTTIRNLLCLIKKHFVIKS